MNSSLYRGTVTHSRLKPFGHSFRYGIYYAMFDIDELPTLDKSLLLFSLERFNLYSFRPSDHGLRNVQDIRPWVEELLAEAGVPLRDGPIELLTLPRVLGYEFNPLSIWYCYDTAAVLQAVLYEVRNTFGDRHVYVVRTEGEKDLRHSFPKRLHVSPFNDMEQTYHFAITKPGAHLSIGIDQHDADGTMFRAGMRLKRLPMTDRNLIRMFAAHPFVTGSVIAGIHWQALRLWLKGARYHRRPEPAVPPVTIEAGVLS